MIPYHTNEQYLMLNLYTFERRHIRADLQTITTSPEILWKALASIGFLDEVENNVRSVLITCSVCKFRQIISLLKTLRNLQANSSTNKFSSTGSKSYRRATSRVVHTKCNLNRTKKIHRYEQRKKCPSQENFGRNDQIWFDPQLGLWVKHYGRIQFLIRFLILSQS